MASAGLRIRPVTATGLATGIDHVGVVVRDLAAASAAWAAAGFAPSGAGNRLVMLHGGYVELLADDPAQPSATLARMLAQGEGAHVLSLRVDDAAAAASRLGLAAGLVENSRPADPARPDGPQARFRRLPLTDQDPRLQLIEHRTPELVWQPGWLTHPNGARALETVTMRAEHPAPLAARLSRLAGLPVTPDPEGGYALAIRDGLVRILPGSGPARIIGVGLRGSGAARRVDVSGVEVVFL